MPETSFKIECFTKIWPNVKIYIRFPASPLPPRILFPASPLPPMMAHPLKMPRMLLTRSFVRKKLLFLYEKSESIIFSKQYTILLFMVAKSVFCFKKLSQKTSWAVTKLMLAWCWPRCMLLSRAKKLKNNIPRLKKKFQTKFSGAPRDENIDL